MRRRTRWAVLAAAASLCLAAAAKTPARPFTDENPVPLLPEGCYEVGSVPLGEERVMVMKVTNDERTFNFRDRRDMDDGWRSGRTRDVRFVIAFEPAKHDDGEGAEAEAGDADAARSESQLVVTTHEGDDASGPVMTIRLDRPGGDGYGASGNQLLRVEKLAPNC